MNPSNPVLGGTGFSLVLLTDLGTSLVSPAAKAVRACAGKARVPPHGVSHAQPTGAA
jgi:hypothetical protein